MAGVVGIRKVAEHAGVSVGTVSNVLNKPDTVAPATLQRVLGVMDELGFVRNDLARQLKMGGGTTIGMIVLNVANPFFGDLAHACEVAAEERGHTVIFGSSDQLPGREDHYIDLFEQQRVRGMLIATVNGVTPRIDRLARRGMPVVLFDIEAHPDEDRFCSVALDGAAGGFLATVHLIETGRRHIAFVGGPLHQIEDRWRGAQRAVAGSSGVALQHFPTEDQTILEGRRAGQAIAGMPAKDRPDAVFAANDLLALGVMQALVLADGIDVPRDIAIVGYDDIDYAASAIVPLTSIRQPVELLASESVRQILDDSAQRADHVHVHTLLPPTIVVRASSAGR